MQRLPPEFFARDATVVAPDLLGKVLLWEGYELRITEVEAYTREDPASHSYRGMTARNAPMFGPPGRWYVYFVYGMHHCLNVVTGAEGDGQAVLIRSVWTFGIASGRTRGPGRLAKLIGADLTWNGRPVELHDIGAVARDVEIGPRVGITQAVDWPRRWVTRST